MLKRSRLLLLSATLVLAPSISTGQTRSSTVAKGGGNATTTDERIHRVETGIPPIPTADKAAPLQLDLPKLMEIFKVPGLSVAVIDNYKIAWTKAYGGTTIGGTTPVTTKTLFHAGSISKTVTDP